jgi:hypothetical protein
MKKEIRKHIRVNALSFKEDTMDEAMVSVLSFIDKNMNNIMIKRLVMPICLLFMSILPLSAENHIFLSDNPITLDSLRVVLSGYTRYKLYFIKEKNQEEIKVTADYKSKNFLERLSYELSQQGYSLTLMGNDIYVLKGEALVTQLPAGYFEKQSCRARVV